MHAESLTIFVLTWHFVFGNAGFYFLSFSFIKVNKIPSKKKFSLCWCRVCNVV